MQKGIGTMVVLTFVLLLYYDVVVLCTGWCVACYTIITDRLLHLTVCLVLGVVFHIQYLVVVVVQ